jgi:hypothetical protein
MDKQTVAKIEKWYRTVVAESHLIRSFEDHLARARANANLAELTANPKDPKSPFLLEYVYDLREILQIHLEDTPDVPELRSQAQKVIAELHFIENNLESQKDILLGLREILACVQRMHIQVKQIRVSYAEQKQKKEVNKKKKKKNEKKGDWKDQLVEIQHKLDNPDDPDNQPDETNQKETVKLIRDSQVLNKFAVQHHKLLKINDQYGIVVAPVRVRHYVTRFGWKMLAKSGFKVSNVYGAYLLIENAILLGINDDVFNDNKDDGGLSVCSQVFARLQETDKRLKGMTLTGDMRQVGPHWYLMCLPGQLVESRNVCVYGWEFATEVTPSERTTEGASIDINIRC